LLARPLASDKLSFGASSNYALYRMTYAAMARLGVVQSEYVIRDAVQPAGARAKQADQMRTELHNIVKGVDDVVIDLTEISTAGSVL